MKIQVEFKQGTFIRGKLSISPCCQCFLSGGNYYTFKSEFRFPLDTCDFSFFDYPIRITQVLDHYTKKKWVYIFFDLSEVECIKKDNGKFPGEWDIIWSVEEGGKGEGDP